ncbi:hypothetical protein ACWY4P_04735 [Streptomyces sp. LZ34]
MPGIPLAVLDLVPIPSGSTAAEALRHTIGLAQQTERFGHARYWIAEHHLNPGVAGTSPAVVLRTPGGLRIPPRFSAERLLGSPRVALQQRLMRQPGAGPQDYGEQIDDILALLRGDYRSAEGVEARAVPGEGAIEFPTPEQARAHPWSDEDRALVADRVETQFVGSPRRVADQLEQLRQATGADELIITTITHRHADRVRSYELLAEEWRRR